MTTTFSRRLSGLERYFLAINEVYRFNAELVIEGSGDVELEQLQEAVAIASAANPGMRVRLKGALGFLHWVDSGITPDVREIPAAEWQGYSDAGADFLEERFHPLQDDHVAQVLLIRGNPVRMVFRALHAAVDGKGLAYWTLDIMRAMRGEAPLGSGNTVTDIDFAQSVVKKSGITLAPPAQHSAPVKAILPISADNGSPFRFAWRCTRFDRNISNPLPKILHFLYTQAVGEAGGNILMTVPVDYRSLRGADAGTGNLTGYIQLSIDASDSPKSIMGKLSEGIKNHRDCAIGIMPFWKLHWIPLWIISAMVRKNLDKTLFAENTAMPNGGISALGMTPPETISFPGFEAMGAFGLATVGRLYVSVTNFPKSTYIMLAAPSRFNGDRQLDGLVEKLRENFA
ncbi:MAG: hypothetical protein PSX71_10825 [bacterium]|nr:hypothetical protein [bacterium]